MIFAFEMQGIDTDTLTTGVLTMTGIVRRFALALFLVPVFAVAETVVVPVAEEPGMKQAQTHKLTELQHYQLYQRCQDRKGFDVVGFGEFVAGILDGDVSAFAAPFFAGYQQKGCDVFLTDNQLRQRDRNQQMYDWKYGRGPGPQPMPK